MTASAMQQMFRHQYDATVCDIAAVSVCSQPSNSFATADKHMCNVLIAAAD